MINVWFVHSAFIVGAEISLIWLQPDGMLGKITSVLFFQWKNLKKERFSSCWKMETTYLWSGFFRLTVLEEKGGGVTGKIIKPQVKES